MGLCFSKNDIRDNQNITGHLPVPERIIKKLYNSIVNLRFKNTKNKDVYATGFFMLIKLKNKNGKYLFTCKHVISDEDIENKIIIDLYYGEKEKENKIIINLDKKIRCIKTFETDIALIELIEEDKISEDKCLIPDLNYEYGYEKYLNNYFYIAGYPADSYDRCVSSGQITYISDNYYDFEHTLSTTCGSSGSPICNETGNVIGIHKQGNNKENTNYGSFIGAIIEFVKNEENKDISNYIKAPSQGNHIAASSGSLDYGIPPTPTVLSNETAKMFSKIFKAPNQGNHSAAFTSSFGFINHLKKINTVSNGSLGYDIPFTRTPSILSFETNKYFHNDIKNIPVPEIVWNKLCNSIVKIQFLNCKKIYKFSTGFFMYITINHKKYKSLITNASITEEDILNKIRINLFCGPKNQHQIIKIKLDGSKRYIHNFSNLEIDATLIEIINNDNIPNDKYLIPDWSYKKGYEKYKDIFFYIAGYPEKPNERCISSGKINYCYENGFLHSLFKTKILSGSPICNEKCEVIGINTDNGYDNNQNGNFIGKILDYLEEEINKKSNLKN